MNLATWAPRLYPVAAANLGVGMGLYRTGSLVGIVSAATDTVCHSNDPRLS